MFTEKRLRSCLARFIPASVAVAISLCLLSSPAQAATTTSIQWNGFNGQRMCLNVYGAYLGNNVGVIMYPAASTNPCAHANEQWCLPSGGTVNGQDVFRVIAKHSGKCLTANAPIDGRPLLVQYTCVGGAQNQYWSFETARGGGYALTLAQGSFLYCLSVNRYNQTVLVETSEGCARLYA